MKKNDFQRTFGVIRTTIEVSSSIVILWVKMIVKNFSIDLLWNNIGMKGWLYDNSRNNSEKYQRKKN